MGLNLESKSKSDITQSREELEAQNLLNDLFEHNEDRGAISTLTIGMPGSCKTTLELIFEQYATNHYPNDKIFWRSSLNAPLQFFKLEKYKIYVEEESGINFIDRISRKNITNDLDITYFREFEELYDECKPAICNAIFFKDMHLKGVERDEGTIRWFEFIRWLLGVYEWKHVFLDEYHEMIKNGATGLFWRKILDHSDDVSNARKSNLSIHGNCHQTSEIDYRVLDNIMCEIQMYGSKPSRHTPISRRALQHISKPNENDGAYAWISSGGRFGKFNIKDVLKLPKDISIMARINKKEENTLQCATCGHVLLRNDAFLGEYCSKSCYWVSKRAKNGELPPSPPYL